MSGGVAIIKVGGSTEVEVKERKDRVDDALHATRAAVEEGVVPVAVWPCCGQKSAHEIKTENDDQKTGINIVRKALSWPARLIAINAGNDGSVVVGKIVDRRLIALVTTRSPVNTVICVIDPTKVVRNALQGAASIAGLLITRRRWLQSGRRRRRLMRQCPAAAWEGWTNGQRPAPGVPVPQLVSIQCSDA